MVKRSLLLIPLALLAMSCGSKERTPYLGKWTLKFTPVSATPPLSKEMLARQELIGYLQVYATKNQYILYLEGEQQQFRLEGTWKLEGKRFILKGGDISIQLRDGMDDKDPNKVFLEPDQARLGYIQDLIFAPSADGRTLTGLQMTIGPLKGTHLAIREGGTIR